MKLIQIILLTIVAMVLLSCASSQDKAYKAQEGIHKERLRLSGEYQKCMKEAADDEGKAKMCDQFLKAAEALK